MKVIIIEDEPAAVRNLKAILSEVAPEISVLCALDSVAASVDYLKNNPQPDLVFLDIHLADGASFLIFNQVKVCCPVIFTTAYDKYALDAFKVNSIDYLLKPIEPSNVIRALDKLKQLTKTDWSHTSEKIIRLLKDNHKYARTLLVEFRDKLTPVAVGDIAYFYTKDDVTLLCSFENRERMIDKTLETLIGKLDPSEFFRANRQFIISHSAIDEVVVWFGNRLLVKLKVPTPERIIISKARVSLFKNWLVNG